MGVYLHAEWILGRLIEDSILYRIYQNASGDVFKRYSGEKLYNMVHNKNLTKRQFNRTLQKLIKSGGDLGPGMKNKYLSLTSSEDPIITAGLRKINNKIYPTIKAFYGSKSKPALYGNMKQLIKPINNKSLSDIFIDLCIKSESVKIMDVNKFSRARLTPIITTNPNRFFSKYSSPCISRVMACLYETFNSIPEKTPIINENIIRILKLCNNFNIPIPRASLFLSFKNLFNRCYKI